MSDSQKVANGKVVTIDYRLSIDEEGLVDESGDEPFAYLHGGDNIVEGLERALEGKVAGDRVKVSVPAAEGYGEREENEIPPLTRADFPDDMDVQPGLQFAVEQDDGALIPLWVTAVDEDQVWVDINHPLAGEVLHFEVSIREVRDATPEELEHGHVHGPGGHHD